MMKDVKKKQKKTAWLGSNEPVFLDFLKHEEVRRFTRAGIKGQIPTGQRLKTWR